MLTNLPLVSLIVGTITGIIVNGTVNEFSFSRKLFADELLTRRHQLGWIQFNAHALIGKIPEFSGYLFRTWAVMIIYTLGFPALIIFSEWSGGEAMLAWITLAYFGAVIVLDIEYKLILYPFVITGVILGSVIGVVRHGVPSTLIGGVAGYTIMYLLFRFGAWLLKVMAARKGLETDEVALGFGDVNLAGVIGLYLGWPGVLAGLYLAIMIGGVTSLALILYHLLRRNYSPFLAIPYGPCLLLSVAWFLYFRPLIIP